MKRKWRKIFGFQYEISNDGRVRRERSKEFIREGKTPSGQPRVRLFKNGIYHWRTIRVLMKEAFEIDMRSVKNPKYIPDEDWNTLHGQDLGPIVKSHLFAEYPNCKIPYEMLAGLYGVSVPIIYSLRHGRGWTKIWDEHHPIFRLEDLTNQ